MSEKVFEVKLPVLCKHCGEESGATETQFISLKQVVGALTRPGASHNERVAVQVIQQLYLETPTYDRT